MEKNNTASLIIKMAVLLMVICAVVSAVLGAVNMITAPVIADIAAAKTAAAYNEVLPSTGEYTPVDYSDANVTAVAKCAEGTVVEVSISGSQSMLALAIGVDNDGAITGVSVIDHGETPGLGAKSTEAAWRAQFAGQTSGLALDKKGGEIAPLTGATITSQAIVDACQIAIDTAANVG
ncbi:MAG: FMN-binding protein [Oscillospiraceae bacterium]|nr:FMN-binding protein [Oscillospiraceae bacterium]